VSYSIDPREDHPDRLVLRESPRSRRALAWILIAIGLAGCAAGVMGVGAPGAGLFAGAGLAFLCAGLLVLTQFKNPPTLTFDNRTGELLVAPAAGGTGAWSATLPYARIQGFEVHRKTVVTSGRSRSTEYTCSMVREDGARWALATTHQQAEAESLCAALKARVKLEAGRAAGESPPEPPAFVEVLETDDVTVLRWKKRVSIGSSLLIAGVVAGFGVIGWGLRPFLCPAVSWLILSGVGLLGLLVVGTTLASLRAHQRVEIGQGRLRNREEGSLLPWGAFDKPLAEIATVLFQFSPNEQAPMLLVVDRAEQEALRSLGTESEPDPLQMASLIFSLRRIALGEMGLDDLLRLERFLEAEIEKRR